MHRGGGLRVDLEFGGDPSPFGHVRSHLGDDVIGDVIILFAVG
jgi:hypothetical protein